MSIEDKIKGKALALGFDAAGITSASPISDEQADHLRLWLAAGYAGQMGYMHRNFEKRIDPSQLLDGAESVIIVALNYKPREGSVRPTNEPSGRVADYALYEDYHPFMRERLGRLADFVISLTDSDGRFKICVDSAPLAERSLAARARLGFIGKNHMLINPALGPEVFLGAIVTTVGLRSDNAGGGGGCGGCEKCIEACPSGALRKDGQFDARRCISYLTIEHKGQITAELAGNMGDRLFGCDECVRVCPYLKEAPACANREFKFYPDRSALELKDVMGLDEASFERTFGDSPIRRVGVEGLKRNARICAANSR
ncbi:MAG: tRNA epoxyqueuosine(34) reductase QueG [Sedimentisphaerales bacterium]|nr:tRNA epoxyqueuosine(34) reductase QueG [Sedimentisphaerales bacterium]